MKTINDITRRWEQIVAQKNETIERAIHEHVMAKIGTGYMPALLVCNRFHCYTSKRGNEEYFFDRSSIILVVPNARLGYDFIYPENH